MPSRWSTRTIRATESSPVPRMTERYTSWVRGWTAMSRITTSSIRQLSNAASFPSRSSSSNASAGPESACPRSPTSIATIDAAPLSPTSNTSSGPNAIGPTDCNSTAPRSSPYSLMRVSLRSFLWFPCGVASRRHPTVPPSRADGLGRIGGADRHTCGDGGVCGRSDAPDDPGARGRDRGVGPPYPSWTGDGPSDEAGHRGARSPIEAEALAGERVRRSAASRHLDDEVPGRPSTTAPDHVARLVALRLANAASRRQPGVVGRAPSGRRAPFRVTARARDHAGMRIGLGAGAPTIDRIIEQAVEAEAAGFTTLWFPSSVLGDPLAAIAVAGRATSSIELGTAVLVTYAAHPLLTAARAASTAAAMGRPGLRARHGSVARHGDRGDVRPLVRARRPAHRGVHAHRGRPRCAATTSTSTATSSRCTSTAPTAAPFPVPVLLGALAPRMLRVAGEVADGTVTWMANREALESHVVPRITAAAAAAGRPAPRVVVGSPGRGARRRRRSARSGGAAVRLLRRPAELRAHPRASADSSARPTRASSATRTRSPRSSARWSTPVPPTCGRRSSPWVTTAGRSHARCSNTADDCLEHPAVVRGIRGY